MGKKGHKILTVKIKGSAHIREVCNGINKSEYFNHIMCQNDLIVPHKRDLFIVSDSPVTTSVTLLPMQLQKWLSFMAGLIAETILHFASHIQTFKHANRNESTIQYRTKLVKLHG